MTNNERLPNNPERAHDSEALRNEAEKHRERLAEQLKENVEKSHESAIEVSRREALETAAQHEKAQKLEKQAHEKIVEKQRPTTKVARKATFDTEMRHVQSHLSPASRTFSKIIHNPAVEKVSDTIGNTVARPNAVLSGAIFAFVLTLGVYLIARFFGYPLSGSETIVAFILGWVIGCLYDFLRVMITGKKA